MIRRAEYKDLNSILKLINNQAKIGGVLPRDKSSVSRFLNTFYVYEEVGPSKAETRILGCVSLEIYNNRLAEIRSLVVSPTLNGKGIGSKLVKKCVQDAKKAGIHKLLSVTNKDIFFEKQGFSKALNGQHAMFINFDL
jgi:amino-acid N-acetyltransferase